MSESEQLIHFCFCGKHLKIYDPITNQPVASFGADCFSRSKNLFAAGCTFDTELMFNLGKRSAQNALEQNIDINGAINTGVIREPMKQGAERMLSEDAHVVYALSKSFVQGAGGAAATGFLGGEQDFCERNCDKRALFELYLRPFVRLSSLLQAAVIPSGLINGEPVFSNAELMSLVKSSLPEGAIILNSFLSVNDVLAAVRSGAGLIVPQLKDYDSALITALKNSKVTDAQIREFTLATRAFIEMIKHKNPRSIPMPRYYDEQKFLCKKSIVLLENNGALPLDSSSRCVTINKSPLSELDSFILFDCDTADKTSAIVFADAPHGKIEKAVIDELEILAKKGLETILVIICPRPCELPNKLCADAVLFVPQVLPDTFSALKDIISGAAEPCGRLPVTWAKSISDYPANANPRTHDRGMFTYESVYNGYRYFDSFSCVPRYPFGHGLSYTDFAISNAKIDVDDESVIIDFMLENLTDRAGETVVFVFDTYLAKQIYGLKRRVVGFERVTLDGKESKRVRMRVESDEFVMFNEIENDYVFLGGKHTLSLAFNAQKDICKAEIKFKKPEPSVNIYSRKMYPSYYAESSFSPMATEVESLLRLKLYSARHEYSDLIFSHDSRCAPKQSKKAAKAIKKYFCGLEIENMPAQLVMRFCKEY